jgi:hypothetical protein
MKKTIINPFLIFLFILNLITTQTVYAGITNPVAGPLGTGQPESALATTVANVWRASLVLGSIGFVLYFAWGALRWMTAEGDKAKFEEGRHKISNALIGLILIAASVAIVQLIGRLLNIGFLETLIFDFPTP